MKNIIFVPIKDYFISRKKVFIKFLIPILIALIALLLSMFFNIGNSEKVISTFSGFIDTQINIVAILISFSVPDKVLPYNVSPMLHKPLPSLPPFPDI